MRTIGILGGMSWESTARYYAWLNEGVRARLGGLHSARILLASVDFAEVEKFQSAGDWLHAGKFLAGHAQKLERAGADFLLLATNTMHKVAAEIEAAITIPFLHIGDATAAAIRARGLETVALLGTKYTMEQDFYTSRLARQGLRVLVPDAPERDVVNRVIYDELCLGKTQERSRRNFLRIANGLTERGAEGIILGCTEISMLISQDDLTVPVFDTTRIHVERALELALERKKSPAALTA